MPSSLPGLREHRLHLEISPRLFRVIRACSRWGLQSTCFIAFPELHQEFVTHQPRTRQPGSRVEPHRFGTGKHECEMEAKFPWFPCQECQLHSETNCVPLQRNCFVSFTSSHKTTWWAWQLLLAHYGPDSSAWGLFHQQLLEQSSSCLGKAWALGVEHCHVSYPHRASGLGAARGEWRQQTNEPAHSWLAQRTFWLYLCFQLLKIRWEGSVSHIALSPGKQSLAPILEFCIHCRNGSFPIRMEYIFNPLYVFGDFSSLKH